MTDEIKTENQEKKQEKTEPEQHPRGERGNVGEATAALTIKQMWREKHFKRTDANDRYNPRKKVWVALPKAPSLKAFARQLAANGDVVAKTWFDHKGGSLNKDRSDATKARISLEKQATKAAKRKKSAGGGGKAKPAA